MDQGLIEVFGKIEKRLVELEKVHCRYQGPPGKPGKDAPAPRVSIGAVTNGEHADAKIRAVDGTFYLDLCLPRGTDGRDGANGISNIPGPVGPRGSNGVDGRVVVGQVVNGHFAAATVRVEDDVQIIDLVLPRGERGAVGPARDVKLRIGEVVSGPTASARLHEEGPPSSYTLDLCLPKGDKGDPGIGERGPQGLPGIGERGPAGVKGDSPTTDEFLKLIRSVIDENPERFRGPAGVGRDGKGGIGIRGPQGKPGDISAAVSQAEQEARNIVREALAEIQARLERLERAAKV